MEILEKVLRVILQITWSRRRGREFYKAIPPRSSCRQDQVPRTEDAWTVHMPPSLKLATCAAKRLRPCPVILRGIPCLIVLRGTPQLKAYYALKLFFAHV